MQRACATAYNVWVQDLYRVVQGIDVFDPKFNIVYVLCLHLSDPSANPAHPLPLQCCRMMAANRTS